MTAAVFGRRVCAVFAMASALLHGVMAGGHMMAVAVAVVMAAVCVVCARELWIAPTTRTWALIAVMNLAMIAVHLPASASHQHGGVVTMTAGHPSAVMALATAIAAIEVAAAAAVLYRRSRGQARALIPSPTG